MKRNLLILSAAAIALSGCCANTPATTQCTETQEVSYVAPTPPMGWNSFDAYDCRINEAEYREIVDYMADHLLEYGWEYAVIDYAWFNDEPGLWGNPNKRYGHPNVRLGKDGVPLDSLCMDQYSRLLPSVKRFPSAANGAGFKPLADYVHSRGLKFGIHIMRGIPRQAYFQKTGIKGVEGVTAFDIAEPLDTCNWQNNLFGVNFAVKGAQEYYDSLFELYAEWGVDFIKADDMMFPPYHKQEIEMMHNAIEKCGRPMVLSLSCGEAPLSRAEHLKENATMWRVSADFWDRWEDLHHSFDLAEEWISHAGPDNWPDADMIPIGRLALDNRPVGKERMSNFTPAEQTTLMTLWSISKSPLMIGADLLSTPMDIVRTYFQNKDIIEVSQKSINNRQVYRNHQYAVWVAEDPDSDARYVALFNVGDKPTTVKFNLEHDQMRDTYAVRNLWRQSEEADVKDWLTADIEPHGAKLYKLTPRK